MISASELLGQVTDAVALLAAPPDEQVGWARSGRVKVPAEEIALQLYDLVDVSTARLRQERVADEADERALRSLVEYVASVQTRLFDGIGVTDAPEWAEVRVRAQATLRSLQRPLDEKLVGPRRIT